MAFSEQNILNIYSCFNIYFITFRFTPEIEINTIWTSSCFVLMLITFSATNIVKLKKNQV